MKKDLTKLHKRYLRADFGQEAAAVARKKRAKAFFVKNIVVIIAVICAVVTCVFVPPDKEYLKYPSYKTLLCLLCLMLVVRGLKDSKFFGIMSGKILDRISDRRAISMVLIFLPALFALFITNDIATLSFIPFAIVLLKMADSEELIPPVLLLQTMAVKLSGIISPLGNAQNLFLIDYYNFEFFWFIENLWPLAVAGYGLTFLLCFFIKKGKINVLPIGEHKVPHALTACYFTMFIFILLSIFDILPYYIITPIILVLMLIIHPRSYKKANYGVIVMFLAFFIISGNLLRMTSVGNVFTSVISGHECFAAIIASQLFTNSPVALIFPTFSTNTVSLMYGINIGKYGAAPLNNYMVYSLDRKYDIKHTFIWKLLGVNLLYLIVLTGVGAMYLYL